MKILVDINHPAHVHLFKNIIVHLRDAGYELYIVARKKDITLKLLDALGFEYITATMPKFPYFRNGIELILRAVFLNRLYKKHKFSIR